MQNALAALQTARAELTIAEQNKGGHRANALNLVNQAITEVQAGIAVGAGM
jgi:inosine/xanthosine triphosphate pyrophosphatase family protein